MTDTYCDINGRKAGSKHKGGFTPFSYDVSDRVFFGSKKNRIEVTVNKESEEDAVNMAERRADYWNFGGIIRPVYVVSKPSQNISRVAIDARHDGHFVSRRPNGIERQHIISELKKDNPRSVLCVVFVTK